MPQDLAQAVQNHPKEIQDAVWLEYTELMNAFADSNTHLVLEILGEEIFNRLTDARKELTQTHQDAREGNLNAQKILKLIVEIPPIMQQISATSSDSIQQEIQKLHILIKKKMNELSQQVSNLSQQKSYEPIANFLEYVKNTLEQILIKPLNAENGIDQLCATLESIQI